MYEIVRRCYFEIQINMLDKLNIMRRLPPLRALKVFEAVARHTSVSAAAEELCVSHSAVSQQVKILEAYFGQSLFRRSGRGIEPTLEASAYLEDVRACLDRLAIASDQLTQRTLGKVLKINATPSFAMRWLIPQTSSFQLANPSIELRISTSATDEIDQLGEPYDFIIRRNVMNRSDHACQRIADDVSTALISPILLEKYVINTPQDLLAVPLLHLKSRPDAWKRWFRANRIAIGETVAGPYFEHFFLSLQAAINGLGAAIGPFALIHDDLTSRRLIAPFPELTLVGPGFHVLYRTSTLKDRAGRLFLEWLLEHVES
jgi:LysR family transcriptional regulator, glycine cleavage system transcriptional activator